MKQASEVQFTKRTKYDFTESEIKNILLRHLEIEKQVSQSLPEGQIYRGSCINYECEWYIDQGFKGVHISVIEESFKAYERINDKSRSERKDKDITL